MKIRNMTIGDYEAVYSLWIHSPGMSLNDQDDSRQGIEKYLARNPGTCFVAEEEGRILGVILGGHDGRRGYIHHAAVAPPYRRRGIGKALLDTALGALKGEGIQKTALVVFADNAAGNAFWEKNGFAARNELIYRNKRMDETKNIGAEGPDLEGKRI
ncbi:MAG: GNAT family N-acetyltransferase [Treponema sp.]|jgi:ribosomal protein S18 acetylase RimI-like enzyme|nr:GNAT family N-acetyltransferase [Treponema sp.]